MRGIMNGTLLHAAYNLHMIRFRRVHFVVFVLGSTFLHYTAVAQDKLFPADAVVNVTLPPYNAVPDDGKDDTAAIQKAIADNVDTGRSIYFPAGTYDISDTLVAKNKGRAVAGASFAAGAESVQNYPAFEKRRSRIF